MPENPLNTVVAEGDVEIVETVEGSTKCPKIRPFSTKKYPQTRRKVFHVLSVDIVDKSEGEELFSDIYNISGPHSYQQVVFFTIF